jgi:transcriptional regulator with XRE-family HTH domain
MDVNTEIADRIEGRMDRLGLSAAEVERAVGLPAGAVAALLRGEGALPRGTALRRLAAVLDVEETFILGLEPGDLIPAQMLEEAQGELGLLAPDEEALLRNYRSLEVPVRAAVGLLVARAAGVDPAATPWTEEKPSARKRGARKG